MIIDTCEDQLQWSQTKMVTSLMSNAKGRLRKFGVNILVSASSMAAHVIKFGFITLQTNCLQMLLSILFRFLKLVVSIID